ncbi:MAG TPA: hypothetical protein VH989_05545 [Actinomycetota bacterium]|jgi:hypothetical protein
MIDTVYVQLCRGASREFADAIDAMVEAALSRTSRGLSADS